ncbi:MAG: hypothetical protein HS108_02415 [Planctomycetes bacterium]|jgi:tetratricopeptide (TPR) repeat protein|nr:hypothetical protein [Planctomycetota bacterium]MCL4731620.1 hypothetical protein [Planctomycetota bacterium]
MDRAEYLFRHVALRDAAYGLQLPSERARLHRLALEILEHALDDSERAQMALALADHALAAQRGVTWAGDNLHRKELEYLMAAAAQAAGRYENDLAISLYERIADHPLCTNGQRVDAMIECGAILWFLGRRQAAIRRLDAAVMAASSDLPRLAFALIERGTLYRDLNQHERAARDLHLALDVARDAGDRRLELRARGNLATVQQQGATPAQVEALFAPVLALAQELGNTRAIGISKGQIAQAYLENGDHARAQPLLLESLELLRRSGDRMNEAVMLSVLGRTYLKRADGDVRGARQKAAAFFRQALAVNESIGNRPQQPEGMAGLARACLDLGLLAEAESFARRALAEGEEMGKSAAVQEAGEVLKALAAAAGGDPARPPV